MDSPANEDLYAHLFNEAFGAVIARNGLVLSHPRPLCYVLLSVSYKFTISGHFGSQVDAWATIEGKHLLRRLLHRLGPISLDILTEAAGVTPSPLDARNSLAASLSSHAHAVDALAALPETQAGQVWANAREMIAKLREARLTTR